MATKTKEEKYTQEDFLKMFREVKTKEKGRKNTTRALIGRTEGNFKKLVKAGYTPEEFREAATEMFNASDQWAVSTSNDTPAHLLQPENFARYLNAAEKKKELEEIKAAEKLEAKEAKTEVEVPTLLPTKSGLSDDEEEEILERAKAQYTESLTIGVWTGGVMEASKLALLFSAHFTLEEKREFKRQGEEIAKKERSRERKGSEEMQEIINRMLRQYPRAAMLELAVIEAVKRKIAEPWK